MMKVKHAATFEAGVGAVEVAGAGVTQLFPGRSSRAVPQGRFSPPDLHLASTLTVSRCPPSRRTTTLFALSSKLIAFLHTLPALPSAPRPRAKSLWSTPPSTAIGAKSLWSLEVTSTSSDSEEEQYTATDVFGPDRSASDDDGSAEDDNENSSDEDASDHDDISNAEDEDDASEHDEHQQESYDCMSKEEAIEQQEQGSSCESVVFYHRSSYSVRTVLLHL
jgi:hypothetical protein